MAKTFVALPRHSAAPAFFSCSFFAQVRGRGMEQQDSKTARQQSCSPKCQEACTSFCIVSHAVAVCFACVYATHMLQGILRLNSVQSTAAKSTAKWQCEAR